MQGPENPFLQHVAIHQSSFSIGTPWRLLPQFMLRQAGFPVEWLDELSSTAIANASSELLDAHDEILETYRATLKSLQAMLHTRRNGTPTVLDQSLIELRARLEKGKVVRPFVIQTLAQHGASSDLAKRVLVWNAGLQRLEQLQQAYGEMYTQNCERASLRLLRRFCDDQRLQEVLLLSNDASFDLFHSWLESHKEATTTRFFNRDDQRKIDTLTMYFQRVCAKNETHSHFGPFSIGQALAERQGIQWDGEGPLERVASYTHWAASELAQQIGQDPALSRWIRPRRISYAFVEKDNLRMLKYEHEDWVGLEEFDPLQLLPPQPLLPEEVALLVACDGERTLQDLFTWWQQINPAATWETFRATLGTLERYGALVIAFEVPVGTCNALGDLRALLPATEPASAAWMKTLDVFQRELQQFAAAKDLTTRRTLFAELKSAFTMITRTAPVRGAGKLYADRSILYEECRRDLRALSVGGLLANAVEDDLALFYDFWLLMPRYRFAAERTMLNAWFVDRFGADQSISVGAYLAAIADDAALLESRYTAIDTEIDAIEKRFEDTLLPPPSVDDALVELDPHTLRGVIEAYHIPFPVLCNPDVMVIAPSVEAIRAGAFQVLVGDCHVEREILSHRSISPFIEKMFPRFADEVMTLCRTLIADDEELVDVLRGHPSKSGAQLILACPDLEIRGRSPKPRQRVLTLYDLSVHQTPIGLRLYAPKLQRFVRPLFPGIFAWLKRNPFDIFGFPLDREGLTLRGFGRAHVPRIVMNRVVIQRECWRIPAEMLVRTLSVGSMRLDSDTNGEFLRTKSLQRLLKLPRYGYAKIPKEPKPIFVDFNSPLLVRQFVRLAKKAYGTIEFTEMLPSHGELWLKDGEGRYTSEFRLAVFSPL